MRNKPTSPDTQPYASLETTTARRYPDQVARHAGEHPAFDPGFIDANRTIWFTVPSDRPACVCGLPARRDRLTCGRAACMGAL
jgi:hypothetical protein